MIKEKIPNKTTEARHKIVDFDIEKKSESEQINMFKNFSYDTLNYYQYNQTNKNPTEKKLFSLNMRYFYSFTYYSSESPQSNFVKKNTSQNLFELIESSRNTNKINSRESELLNLDLIPFSNQKIDDKDQDNHYKNIFKKKITCKRCCKEGHIQAFCKETIINCKSCMKSGHFQNDCLNKPLPIPRELIENQTCYFCGKKGHLICKAKNLVIENNSNSSFDSDKDAVLKQSYDQKISCFRCGDNHSECDSIEYNNCSKLASDKNFTNYTSDEDQI